MDRYIYVRSDESNVVFTNNETYRFRVQLDFPLYLPGMWKVALVEFHATEKPNANRNVDDGIYIYTDLCKESIVCGEERPLLRRLEKSSKGRWDYIFDMPFYVKVVKSEVREFEIYIKSENDVNASDLYKPVQLTLHVKPYPFL